MEAPSVAEETLGDRLAGVLLGTAIGDALGLPMEGMGGAAIAKSFARLDRYQMLGGAGFVSDDTEQSALVAQALARHPRDLSPCVASFRRALLGWFARLPRRLVEALHDRDWLIAWLSRSPSFAGPTHLRALAAALVRARSGAAEEGPTYFWPSAALRNVLLFPVVLAHAFRVFFRR